LLQSLHVPRVFFASGLLPPEFGLEVEDGEVPSSWMMVLLEKQVHLQKDVEAA
jgi:hypothetical protein